MQSTPSHDLAATKIARGAGVMLREAREAAGISCDELCRRTRLERRIIDAIESEDYNSLAAAAFVKGYIRSLAKELNIDPTPILAQYNQSVTDEDPLLADFNTRSPIQITSSSTLMRGISGGLAFVVVVLIALWWQRNYQSAPDSPGALARLAAEAALEIVPDPGTPLPYSYTIVDHSTEPLDPVNSWRRQTDGSAPPRVELEREEPVVAEKAAPKVTPPKTVPDESTPTANSEPPATEGAATLETVPAPTSGELTLTGNGESWIEISDFAGKRLYFGLIKPGQQIGLTGRPPYDLVIGNASVVNIDYLGQSVDVRARAVNGVARFSLGEPH
jgi:cytoskeleton protein RodZ